MKLNPENMHFFLSLSAWLYPFVLHAAGFYQPPEIGVNVCGLYILGPVFWTLVLVVALSVTGIVLGIFAYKKTPSPRPLWSNLELLLLFTPLVCVLVIFADVFLS